MIIILIRLKHSVRSLEKLALKDIHCLECSNSKLQLKSCLENVKAPESRLETFVKCCL